MNMRVGQGFDAHRFGGSRPLVIGGVEIPGETGLEAHSDGDVLIHALIDALLGAAAMGDIGHLFPDSDARYRGADSRMLLTHVRDRVQQAGLSLVNADLTIIAQRPRMSPHIDAMCACLAADLQVAGRRVNVKATTTERMGFAGRGEGIAAMAVVLLREDA